MVVQLTIADAILEQMANDHRVVLSAWRAALYVRRATYELPEERRRWHQFPTGASDVVEVLAQMRARNALQTIPDGVGLNRLSSPFTRHLALDEHELLFEIHPYAALSHNSALIHHGLSTQREIQLTISIPSHGRADLLPLGTTGRDWEGASFPPARIPRRVGNARLITKRVDPAHYFGLIEVEPVGIPLRYTGLERSLIDAIQSPRLCGGAEVALTAWYDAAIDDRIDVDSLIRQVDRLDIGILRQRVGYLMEELGYSRPRLDRWRQLSQRGGSSRLIAYQPFSPEFSERWNLSLNTSLGALYNT